MNNGEGSTNSHEIPVQSFSLQLAHQVHQAAFEEDLKAQVVFNHQGGMQASLRNLRPDTELSTGHASVWLTDVQMLGCWGSPLSRCYSGKESIPALPLSVGDHDRGHCSQGACGCPYYEFHWYSLLWNRGGKKMVMKKGRRVWLPNTKEVWSTH